MREHFVIDPLIGKRQQLLLATQLCRMVLKVRLTHPLTSHSTPPTTHADPTNTLAIQVNQVIIAGSDEMDF